MDTVKLASDCIQQLKQKLKHKLRLKAYESNVILTNAAGDYHNFPVNGVNEQTVVEITDRSGDETLTYLGEVYFSVQNGPVNITINVIDRERRNYMFEVCKLY